MMDCKNALAENDGDYDKAVEYCGSRAPRTSASVSATAEGLVAGDGRTCSWRSNSETDFVAKNEEFGRAGRQDRRGREEAAQQRAWEQLKNAELEDGKTVADAIQELSAKIGEKLELRRVAAFDGKVNTYLHRRGAGLPPAVGVLVEYTGDNEEAAHNAALQVAALKPKYLTRDDVPADVVENERRIAEQTARDEGKPEQAIAKIVEGKVNAFFKDVVLLEQPSVTDSKKTVKQLLDEAGVTITRFARFEVGQA